MITKLQLNIIWRVIKLGYIKELNMPVISVIIKLQNKINWSVIKWLYIQKLNMTVMSVITTRQYYLKRHQVVVHDGVTYACNQCDYQASTQQNLNIHKMGVHEGVKYACLYVYCNLQYVPQFRVYWDTKKNKTRKKLKYQILIL